MSLGLRRMNGKMFYVRVPRAQPKKPIPAQYQQQQPPVAAQQQQIQQQRAPNQPSVVKPVNGIKIPPRPLNDGSPKAENQQVCPVTGC